MSDLRTQLINEHIDRNYPNAKIVNYNDPDSGLSFYTSDQLQEIDEDWFPLSCYRDPESGKVMYGGRKKVVHTYTEGETGAGKTTRFVIQSIRALSSMKVKPSFVLVDIHGEIIENLYTHLKKNGYKICILNCDDPQKSDSYNPFSELAEECLKNKCINSDAINKIRRIAEIMQPIESSKDPIWDMGACSYTNGCIMDKFEDLISGNLPIECMTIYNIIQHHYWIRSNLKDRTSDPLFQIPHYRKKGSKALSVQKIISIVNNAEKTRASYFGVIENHFDSFGQPSLYSLSSSNTIDISDFIDEPTVIVIQSGSTKIGDDLISLLMNEIYTAVVKVGKANARKKLPRKIHCFLDEFANCNIADGPEYVKMLTTSRKFGMYWHMILQCDAQLDRKYDSNIGRIIRANCTEIFMGSNDYETSVRFAKSCGHKTIESIGSVFSGQTPTLNVVDLMTTEQLNLTEEGYAYIKSNKHSLLKAYYEAFYVCEEFTPVENIDDIYPKNDFDYTSTAFFPNDIPAHLTQEEFDCLLQIDDEPISLDELKRRIPLENLTSILKSLVIKNAVKLMDNQTMQRTFNQKQLRLIKYRLENGIEDTVEEDDYKSQSYSDGPRRHTINHIDFDSWLNTPTEPNIKFGASTPSLYEIMKDHVENNREAIDPRRINELTFISKELVQLFNAFYYGNDISDELDKFDIKIDSLTFDVMEEFIFNNSFDKKIRWINSAQREFRAIKESRAFPPIILEHFKKAIEVMDTELTLQNIKEIKRIITEARNK